MIVVRVCHINELSPGRVDAAHRSAAVSPFMRVDEPGVQFPGNILTPIGAAVVRGDHFTGNLVFAQGARGGCNAGCEEGYRPRSGRA